MSFDPGTYWNERHQKTSGLAGVGYLGLGSFNDWMYRVRAHVFRRALAPFASRLPSARVLDVGCGSGFYLDLWRELRAREILGVDISEVACARLRPRYDVRCLDMGAATEADRAALGSLDVVSMMDVLYHLVDDAHYTRALHNIAQCLRPDGLLVFTENFLQHTLRQTSAWQVSRTKSEIEAMCHEAGLVIESRVPCFVLMNNPLDTDRALLGTYWKTLQRIVRRSTLAGHLLGAGLYPLELGLTRLLPESPTSELAIARRR